MGKAHLLTALRARCELPGAPSLRLVGASCREYRDGVEMVHEGTQVGLKVFRKNSVLGPQLSFLNNFLNSQA